MPILPEKIRFKNSIAARLALYILIYSSIITLILTATQLYRDYRHELAGIENQFKQIRIASLPSIRHNLWVVNSRALQSQINDLHALPNMQYLEVRDEQNKPIARAGTQKDKNIIIREFPLLYLHRGKEVPIGSLHIHITLEAIYEHLLDTAIVILISQAAKTFLVSIFILFLFQWLVTRHLSTIASWAKKLDVKGIDHALVLERQERNHEQRDELDIVTSAFNEMRENLNAVYQKLQRSHDQLQDQVEERTKKLQISNQELDSFCYSVSHDLRSPLRGISGFSEILMEEYADHLDSQGRDYLMRIQKAGVRMSDLIDDLLRLSRLSQTPLRREDCNLSSMVETIITSLRHNHSQRQVEVQIEPRLHACADTSLIRVALENLLGNAWKYTHRPNFLQRYRTRWRTRL